ncbi:MAG: hypothetical protein IT180_10490 [Acidobacteria bacterium]|nr:hypothetical protein [Acidobacteriota bacterium]
MTRHARGRALAILVLLPAWTACEARPAPVARPATATATRWHSLGTWSGHGDRQTESFDVTTGALRLTWKSRGLGTPDAGRLRVSLFSSISGRPLQTIVDTKGTGGDTAYLEDEPRVSYLEIESDQVEWTVTLDEAVPGSAAGQSPR